MTSDTHVRPRWAGRAAVALGALLGASILAGCVAGTRAPSATPVRSDTPAVRAPSDPLCPTAGEREPHPVASLVAYHDAVRQYIGIERLRATALGTPGEGAFAQMCQAIVLSEPGTAADLPRAWSLLTAVLKAEDADALVVRPLAQMLAENLQERLRLTRMIERVNVQLRTNEKARATLQQKLDALTEIERNLPARPSPDTTLPPPTPNPVPRKNAE